MRFLLVLAALVSVALVVACSSIRVKRVGPNDYETEGFRYYLPRPYVVVKKPFLVGGDVVFVEGTVEDGRVVGVKTGGLPLPVRRHFAAEDKKSVVVQPTLPSRATAAATPSDSGGPVEHSDEPGSASEDAPMPLANATWLAESSVDPQVLQAEQSAFTVTAVLSDKHVLAGLSELVVGLVPLGEDGTPAFDRFQPCTTTSSPEFKASTKLTYKAIGLREQIKGGPLFLVAVKMTAHLSGETESGEYVAATSDVKLTIVAPQPADEPKKEKSTEVESESPSKAKAALSGDPSTPVINDLGELFDLLYLPDFDQQYAIQMTAGVGEASMDLGLENGWLIEKASLSVDNTEIGKFIFSQIDKATSLAADAVRVANGIVLPGAAATAGDVEQSTRVDDKGNKSVLLKISYALEAQPGIYPLLKPDETCSNDGNAEYVHLPYRPYTVIAFNVRRTVVVELVTPDAQTLTARPASPNGGTAAASTTSDVESSALKSGLEAFAAALPAAEIELKRILNEIAASSPRGHVVKPRPSDAGTLYVLTSAPWEGIDAANACFAVEGRGVELANQVKTPFASVRFARPVALEGLKQAVLDAAPRIADAGARRTTNKVGQAASLAYFVGPNDARALIVHVDPGKTGVTEAECEAANAAATGAWLAAVNEKLAGAAGANAASVHFLSSAK